jgi:cystathionine gamma-synthase
MSRNFESHSLEPETLAACTGVACDPNHGSVMPPLFLSSNYSFDGFGVKRAYDYTRSGNPTRDVLGEALAALEEGAGAVVVSSGMAAIDLVLNLVEPSQTVIAPHDCYGGTWRLLNARAKKGAFKLKLVDQSDLAALDAELKQGTGLVLIETPSNPLMRVVDVAKICARQGQGLEDGGGQYLPLARAAEADSPRRGPGDPFDHQVPERPLRRGRRRRGRKDQGRP